jgi:hypothetical protein
LALKTFDDEQQYGLPQSGESMIEQQQATWSTRTKYFCSEMKGLGR